MSTTSSSAWCSRMKTKPVPTCSKWRSWRKICRRPEARLTTRIEKGRRGRPLRPFFLALSAGSQTEQTGEEALLLFGGGRADRLHRLDRRSGGGGRRGLNGRLGRGDAGSHGRLGPGLWGGRRGFHGGLGRGGLLRGLRLL